MRNIWGDCPHCDDALPCGRDECGILTGRLLETAPEPMRRHLKERENRAEYVSATLREWAQASERGREEIERFFADDGPRLLEEAKRRFAARTRNQ